MLDINKYLNKLVQALEHEGLYYNITTKRFFSKNVKRYVTKYTLQDCSNPERCIEVYNKLEILKALVREFSVATGKDIPEGCQVVLEARPVKQKKKRSDYKRRGSIILD